MQIIIVSDNHGHDVPLRQIKAKYPNVRAILHCGDSEQNLEQLDGFYNVRGNNDFADLPQNVVVDIDGLRIYMTHGHRLFSLTKNDQLAHLAKKNNCQIACYGHTHVFDHRIVDQINIINPGSLWHSRDGGRPSYAVVDIENGQINVIKVEI